MKARISHKSVLRDLPISRDVCSVVVTDYLLMLPIQLGGPSLDSIWDLSIEQIAAQAELPVQKLIQHLQRTIATIGAGIEIEEWPVVVGEARAQQVALWDLRQMGDERRQIVDGSVFVDDYQLSDLLKDASGKDKVVCFCNDGRRSLSAALSLREEFALPAYVLAGGLRGIWSSN